MDSDRKLITRRAILTGRLSLLSAGAGLLAMNAQAQSSGSMSTPSRNFDIVVSFAGISANTQLYLRLTFDRSVTLLGNMLGSVGSVGTNATGTTTVTVAKNGSTVGSISVSTIGVFTFTTTSGNPVSFVSGDVLTLTGQATADVTMSDFSTTLKGQRQS